MNIGLGIEYAQDQEKEEPEEEEDAIWQKGTYYTSEKPQEEGPLNKVLQGELLCYAIYIMDNIYV